MFAASVKDLSNRALHPGRTDPKGMAALLRSYGAIKDDAASYSLVDVGSGDGHFALGLARAFPNAGVCGIEAQKDLYEESLRVAGRDCNFIHGLAEKELWRCASARVVISTTHNFDASSVESIVRVAARLPAVTHLVVGESSPCTPRCKAVLGPCCCFGASRLGGGANTLGELAPHLLALPARRAVGAGRRQHRARLRPRDARGARAWRDRPAGERPSRAKRNGTRTKGGNWRKRGGDGAAEASTPR